jgi:DNA-directed RNA polymerase alpha subunit
MKLVLEKKHGNRIEFTADVDYQMANMVRRYSMSYVPVLAVDSVVFYDNTTAFWDEYIAHRLGLMPVITPDKTPESAEIVFTLDAQGPKTVLASEMTSSDKEISFAKGNIAVVTLGAEQRLRLEGKAILATGRKHAKFQAGIVSYGEIKDGIKFMVESFYQMEPADVILRGCDVIESHIETIEEALGVPSKKKKAKKEKEEKPEKAEKAEKPEKKEKSEKADKPEKKPKKSKKKAEESEGKKE